MGGAPQTKQFKQRPSPPRPPPHELNISRAPVVLRLLFLREKQVREGDSGQSMGNAHYENVQDPEYFCTVHRRSKPESVSEGQFSMQQLWEVLLYQSDRRVDHFRVVLGIPKNSSSQRALGSQGKKRGLTHLYFWWGSVLKVFSPGLKWLQGY